MSACSIYDLAAELLSVANAALATTREGAISRAFVSPGLPAFDCCPQLTTHAAQLAEFSPDIQLPQSPMTPAHRTKTGWINGVALVVTVIRCSPGPKKNGDPPDAADLDAAGLKVNEDAWALWNTLHLRHRDGSLFAGYPCRALYIDPAIAITPQGGCAGWTLTVRVEHDGYDPEGP